jgi:hypothetical protein
MLISIAYVHGDNIVILDILKRIWGGHVLHLWGDLYFNGCTMIPRNRPRYLGPNMAIGEIIG